MGGRVESAPERYRVKRKTLYTTKIGAKTLGFQRRLPV